MTAIHLLAHLDSLLADPLQAARQGHAKGQRVIGYVSAAVPAELILAADAIPVRLRPSARPTPHADEYLESSFLPECRGIAELWLTGALDFLDIVVLPRNDDSAQRLYYYISELQRTRRCAGPKAMLFDIATLGRDTSLAHTVRSTQLLAKELGTDLAKLAFATQRVAARTAHLQAVREKGLPGDLTQRIIRASEYDWSPEFDRMLRDDLPAATADSTVRIVLAGSVPPDDRLHRFVNAAQGTVVREMVEMECASRSTWPHTANDIEAIAQRYYQFATPAQHMLRTPTWIADEAKAQRADGVILWLIEEDEALPWEVPAQVRALTAAHIPVLPLTRQKWLADDETERAIVDFVQSLRGKP